MSNRYAPLKIDGIRSSTNRITKQKKYCSVRTDAFNILSNTSKLKYSLRKTKMCNKKNCSKHNCNYAHSPEELQVIKCLFGDKCIYQHSKNKMCIFIHPNEDKESYCQRISNNQSIKKIIL